MTITVIVIGLIINCITGITAFRLHAVTVSGLIAGVITGTVIYASGGWVFWCVLFSFFASSSVLSAVKKRRKRSAEVLYQKTGARDWVQVMANCGPGTLCAIGWALTGNDVFAAGFAASFAASNADTWASEIGPLSKKEPVLITTFQRVPRGQSGAVSPLGTAAALSGALFIAVVFILCYIVFGGAFSKGLLIAGAAGAGGFAGSLADSILGATLQAQYLCTETNAITEKTECYGKATQLVRGYRVMNNDAVNALSSLGATVVVMLVTK